MKHNGTWYETSLLWNHWWNLWGDRLTVNLVGALQLLEHLLTLIRLKAFFKSSCTWLSRSLVSAIAMLSALTVSVSLFISSIFLCLSISNISRALRRAMLLSNSSCIRFFVLSTLRRSCSHSIWYLACKQQFKFEYLNSLVWLVQLLGYLYFASDGL